MNNRTVRNEFAKSFSPLTRQVVTAIVRGWTAQRIADKFGIVVTSVHAYRANLTRGQYAPFVNANGTGTCNYVS